MTMKASLGAQVFPANLGAAPGVPPFLPQFQFEGIDEGRDCMYVYGTIVATGSYPAYTGSGGDTVDLTLVKPPIPTTRIPIQVSLTSQSPAGMSGFTYLWRPGTTLANGRVQVQVAGTTGNPHQELAAGAYPASVLSDVIVFCAVFVKE